jgi:hypothetical protein
MKAFTKKEIAVIAIGVTVFIAVIAIGLLGLVMELPMAPCAAFVITSIVIMIIGMILGAMIKKESAVIAIGVTVVFAIIISGLIILVIWWLRQPLPFIWG